MSRAPVAPAPTTINSLVPVRPQERGLVGTFLLHSFLVGLTTSVFFVVANGFYLQQATVQQLPLVYAGAGLAGIVMVAVYKWCQQKIGVQATYMGVLGFLAVAATTLWTIYRLHPDGERLHWWLATVGFGMVYPLSVLMVMGFAQIHNTHFNLEQIRRLGSFTGTGEVIASVLGYLTIPVLLQQGLPVSSLYLISAVLACISIVPLLRLPKAVASPARPTTAVQAPPPGGSSFQRSIALFSFLMVLLLFVSDYAYLLAVKELAVITSVKAAILVSYLFSIIKIGEFLVSLFSGRLLGQLGLQKSLWLLPVVGPVICGAAGLALFLFDDPLIFVIIFLLLNKVVERVLRKALVQPALKVIYQAAGPGERIALQTRLEGYLNQTGTICAGLLLLALLWVSKGSGSALLFFGQAVVILLIAGLGWLAATRYLLSSFRQRVRRVVLSEAPAPVANPSTIEPSGQLAGISALLEENSLSSLSRLLQNYYPTPLKAGDLAQPTQWAGLYVREAYPYSRALLLKALPLMPEDARSEAVTAVLSAANSFQQTQLLRQVAGENAAAPALISAANLLVEPTARRIGWLMALLHDCREAHPVLHTQARQVLRRQQELLLAVLRTIYGKDHLPDDRHLLSWENSGDEQLLFALELLEANLPDYHRLLVLPLFQPLPWPVFEAKMKPQFPLDTAGPAQRSRDWLMAEYQVVMPHHKLWFLEHCPPQLLPANTLDALQTNSWIFLQQAAQARLQQKQDVFLQLRKDAAAQVSKQLLQDYTFLAHGMQAQTVVKKKITNRWSGHGYLQQFTQPNYLCQTDLIAAAIALNA